MDEATIQVLQRRISMACDASSALRTLTQDLEDESQAEDCHIWRINIEGWIRQWQKQLEVEDV